MNNNSNASFSFFTELKHMGPPKHDFKILTSCAGLGMGNASRMCAVMEALEELVQNENISLTFHIVSWGAGYNFLSNFKENTTLRFELTEIQSYRNQSSLLNFFRCYFSNSKKLKHTINQFKPNLLLLDSDYHFLSYYKLRIPKISISQASDVLARIPLNNYKPNNIFEKLSLFFREQLDVFFQKIFFTKILVPSFSLKSNIDLLLVKIPLIVRKEFLTPHTDLKIEKIGILLSGSEIEVEAFTKLKQSQSIQIISPKQNNENLITHAKALDKFDIIFTQGGLSSISEVIARNKFLVVFPIKNHPEQIINALEVERLGLGIKSSTKDLNDFSKLLKNIQHKQLMTVKSKIDCTGAQQAAKIIAHYFF
jgi:predicted glycosyltransferase